MSEVLKRYHELSNKKGEHKLPHRDAAILTLAETIDRWMESITDEVTGTRTVNTYDNSREN